MKHKIKVIDSFFDQKDFDALNHIKFDSATLRGTSIFHSEINKNDKFINTKSENSIIKEIHNKYNKKLVNILKEINPTKVELYDYSIISIVKTGKDFKFPIHDDTPDKLLSGVIYLDPIKNCGTKFYSSKDGKEEEMIEWKKNRAVFFSRIERETWHAYEGNNQEERKVLVYNLATKKLKEVFKIEKKNYLYGMMRFKANPLIYKIFKKVI
jgi:hypothetical protein